MAALTDMLAWLVNGGEVGIYNATNSTAERRALVNECCLSAGVEIVFIESVCEDEEVIATNTRQTKLHMPDYAGMDPKEAVADFRARIAQYEKVYETVQEDEGSFVKLIDVGRKLVTYRVDGFLPSAARLLSHEYPHHPAADLPLAATAKANTTSPIALAGTRNSRAPAGVSRRPSRASSSARWAPRKPGCGQTPFAGPSRRRARSVDRSWNGAPSTKSTRAIATA